VVVLQYDTEFVNGGKKPNKKGILYSVRTPLVDNVKNWVWVIYEPPKDVNSYGHFFPVTAISRLLSQSKNKGECHYCPMCLYSFRTERTLTDHMRYCKIHGNPRIEMPAEGKYTLQFKNFPKFPATG
jgi:hypothetical protein